LTGLPTAAGAPGLQPRLGAVRTMTVLLWRLSMNTIIYIVGLVVIIGVILSYFGFR
jgi:hypothetical protein